MKFLFEPLGHRSGTAGWPVALAAVVILIAAPAYATSFDETVSGDLSNDPTNPTNIGGLTSGNNQIVGATDPSGGVLDNDYVTFTVPNGDILSGITLASGSAFEAGDRMFLGIAQGGKVIVDPDFTSANGLLGWTLVDTSMVGSDVLPDLRASAPINFPAVPGAAGFTGPLEAGMYTLWMLDGDHAASYDLDLVVAPAPEQVPEAPTWLMVLAGLGMIRAVFRLRNNRRLDAAV